METVNGSSNLDVKRLFGIILILNLKLAPQNNQTQRKTEQGQRAAFWHLEPQAMTMEEV